MGKHKGGIDYIAINQRYRNAVRRGQSIHGWRGNMGKQRQRDVIRMGISFNFMEKYHRQYQPETGAEIKYDIQEIRQNPDAIQKWYEQRWATEKRNTPENNEAQKERTAKDQWGSLHAKIQTRLRTTYPIAKGKSKKRKT